MNLDEFLHNLHFDVDKASIPNWEVDWEDGPLAYKLYYDLPKIPLSLDIPLTLEGQDAPEKPDFRKIGHFLWYVYGMTQFSQSVFPMDSTESKLNVMQSYRRFAPSGGGLYPNELYVYLKIDNLPEGIYHFDPSHHRLVLLREGNFDNYLARSLGYRCDLTSCFGTVFISTMFWKNFFKYNNFAYRLQGLDTGVLMGQLLEVAKRFGFASGVYYQYLDRAINHLLGLAEQEESVYAVIPLSVEPTIWSGNRHGVNVIATELVREITPINHKHYVKSKRIKEFPMLLKMNEASMLDSTPFRWSEEKENRTVEGKVVPLPLVKRLSYDFKSTCQKRMSPDMDFILGKVSLNQLAHLLNEATASFYYRNDVDEIHQNETRVSIFACLYNIEGILNGAYFYDNSAHALRLVNSGDHRLILQSGMSLANVNLLQVPITIHVVGNKYYEKDSLGYRGYRIQQMEAGMLVQRLLLAASALDMGGHPLLGFDANLSDQIYNLGPLGKTSFIQIPIGPFRQRPWLMGRLHT
ncbi:SagB family peptide dehydrogenase [Metabacillus halosaccharovorans]|uniref:SagB family peptide dehydrogenase n=1 Tax=Metabacillus halosaccharovorans TaxID=930124 RepID=UPI001C1F5693|nr:SagB family peptide dehydrogenase [Metabacillus halosaccharovorans]MBU7592698.1 SagB/ThcOx family dehydrogenase [Metabacillus halosaccharovorans]